VFGAERELSRQPEAAYRRLVSDWQPSGPVKEGRGRDTGARISNALEGQSRAAGRLAPEPALRFVDHPHRSASLAEVAAGLHLTSSVGHDAVAGDPVARVGRMAAAVKIVEVSLELLVVLAAAAASGAPRPVRPLWRPPLQAHTRAPAPTHSGRAGASRA
jgi:hypothetical protein